MISPTNQALILAKKNEHYFVHLYQMAKTPITITRLEEDLVMYLRQSRQILSLKKRSILTAHQKRHLGLRYQRR